MSDFMNEVRLIKSKVDEYSSLGKKMFLTSSFQTHSIPMLHLFSKIDRDIPVYFMNTGFHFPETIIYKNQIAELLGINVISLVSSMPKVNQRNSNGKFFYATKPSYCCQINKILPLEPILIENDIWVTGVRGDQNANRKAMGMEAPGAFNTMRFHPMINWTSKMIFEYRKEYELPAHPLEAEGYLSIGCEPCTEKFIGGGRDGRWGGMKKTECGLHTDLIKK